jgi:hypothetical protein
MAYFPNGMSFYYWQEQNCHDCVNYRDNGTGSYGCAISDAHFILADKMLDDKGEPTAVATTLGEFVPDDGLHAGPCKMRLTKEMIEEAVRHDQEQIDLERYLAAMEESKAA